MVYIPYHHKSQYAHTNPCRCLHDEPMPYRRDYYTHPCGRQYIEDELVKMNGQQCTRCNDIIDVKKKPSTVSVEEEIRYGDDEHSRRGGNDSDDEHSRRGGNDSDDEYEPPVYKCIFSTLWKSIFDRKSYSKVPEKES